MIYISCCTVLMGIIPGKELRISGAPFADAAGIMLGSWAAIGISLAAILKASGSLVGWILIVAQSAQAAANDGMFPRRFASTNQHGMPVQNLVITGLMMMVMLLLSTSPDVATQFAHITDATVILMSVPYIYSVVAMWRMNQTLGLLSGKTQLFIVIGVIAWLYCLSVVIGQSAELDRKALLVLLVSMPLFALVKKR
ncbi:MAG TPA: amino acid permease [Dyella sp.]|nr:amino acid permease [Dyella sp.]